MQQQIQIYTVFAKTHCDLFLPDLPLIVFSKSAVILFFLPMHFVPSWLPKDCPQQTGLFVMRVCHSGLSSCFCQGTKSPSFHHFALSEGWLSISLRGVAAVQCLQGCLTFNTFKGASHQSLFFEARVTLERCFSLSHGSVYSQDTFSSCKHTALYFSLSKKLFLSAPAL